jgi:hypothetical protein
MLELISDSCCPSKSLHGREKLGPVVAHLIAEKEENITLFQNLSTVNYPSLMTAQCFEVCLLKTKAKSQKEASV